jgi:hypothetical protein
MNERPEVMIKLPVIANGEEGRGGIISQADAVFFLEVLLKGPHGCGTRLGGGYDLIPHPCDSLRNSVLHLAVVFIALWSLFKNLLHLPVIDLSVFDLKGEWGADGLSYNLSEFKMIRLEEEDPGDEDGGECHYDEEHKPCAKIGKTVSPWTLENPYILIRP